MNPFFVLSVNGRDKLGHVTNPTIYYLRTSCWQLLRARGRLNWLYCRVMKGLMRFPRARSAQGFGDKGLDSNSTNWLGISYDKVLCIKGTHSACAWLPRNACSAILPDQATHMCLFDTSLQAENMDCF